MKMRKLVALVTAVMMLCCIIPFTAVAADNSATIDFTDSANRLSYSTEQQVWQQNGITVTNDKGASTSNVGDYGGEGYPARFYKSSTVTIEYPGMTKIVIEGVQASGKDYATPWSDSFSANATASVDGTTITIVLAEPADSFTWEKLSAQARANSITIYGEGGGAPVVPDQPDQPDEPDEPDTPVTPDEPTVPSSSAIIDFTDLANRVSCTTSEQVWQQNGITFINDKGASTSNVNEKYYNPVRCYKSSTVTIEYPGMTKIVIDSVTYADNDYAIGWTDSFSADATATVVDGDVTIVLAEPADVFVWEKLSAQSRAYTITVYTGEGGDTPDTPVDPEPDQPDTPVIPDGTELTIADAIAYGQTFAHNAFSEIKYYVTGVITEVYNTQYGNMKLSDEDGNILTIYGTWNEDGTVRYDAMENAPEAGDTVVLYGIIGQYNGTSQMKNGWIMGIVEGDTPDTPDTPVVPDEPTDSWGVVTNPVEGVAYKLGLDQTQKGAIYYFTGAMSSYYGATDTGVDNAVDMYVEIVDGGYKLYFNNGSKQYIKLEQSGTHYNFTFGATGSVFTLDTDLNAFCAPAGDQICYMGTYGTYATIGCLTTAKMSDSDYIARLYGEVSDTPDTPDTPDVPVVPDEPDIDDEIDTTIPYLLGMVQENVSTEDIYFINGAMNSYYMDTTTDEEAALWVYLEKTDGGYYLYALDENDDKVYINMVVSGTHVNGAYEYTASTVYNYDWDLYTLVAEVNDDIYAFGTRNDREYTTMGPVKVSYNGFHADLYYFEDDVEDPCEHEYDNACDDECNICGELREVPDHEYSDAFDADCNNCGYIRDLPIYGGVIAVVQNSGYAGENVNVDVQVDNNPGIVSAKVKVYFDNTILEFVSAAEGDFSSSGYSWSDPTTVQEKGYIIINWCDATKPNSFASLLATLTFKIKEDAPVGFTDLIIEFNCEADIFNSDDKTVYFDAINGAVEVLESAEILLGDVNGDGNLNNRDLGILQKYLNGFQIAVDELASDLTGDGKVNNRDLGLLQKLLNS